MVEGLVFRGRGPDNMKVEAGSLSIPLPSPPLPPRASRLVCLVAAILAFLLGVAVGVTLPLVLARSPISAPLALPQQQQQVEDVVEGASMVVEGGQGITPPLHTWAPPVANSHTPGGSTSSSVTVDSVVVNQTRWGGLDHDAPDVEEGAALLVDEVYWGAAVEAALPKGFPDHEVDDWRKFTRRQAVVRLQEGCGRMQNRLLTFENGTQSCCRYRQNYDQIQGEIFSFYLSRLLGLTNVPPSALGVVRAGAWQWAGVGGQLALAQWAEERPVVMTRFVEGLAPAFIPTPLRSSRRRLHPLDVEERDPRDLAALAELAQWSDLIIFDYLTANLDRVVNNLYNMQWNPSMMEAPAHNLARHAASGLLVFLDNESGLLHGYRLLDKYETFHASLLQALCVFRRSTAEKIRQLVASRDVGQRLRKMFGRHEPDLQDVLPPIPDKSVKILNERLQSVHKQISKCEKMYMNS
ncbi:extracellular serine/threonine protein kinase four-jointed-like [Homarus americanus]|uniref:Extracellular serine/threonine protein kinase four-jointed-like 2 n=1 Tax=Homarus americanus TaxID=6706 RepID=A0A8J5JZ62_HOMAM|nr:extracellular serine/threonine protein kinase four-jointed-like [Homarus americanus]KAG7165236.1 Extracellular serine/threonine protein kinase four-jointed-like 2 [Homarus americanus]